MCLPAPTGCEIRELAVPQSLQSVAPVTRTASTLAICHGMEPHTAPGPADCPVYPLYPHGICGARAPRVALPSLRCRLQCPSLDHHVCPTQCHCLFKSYSLIVGLCFPIYTNTEEAFFPSPLPTVFYGPSRCLSGVCGMGTLEGTWKTPIWEQVGTGFWYHCAV